MTQLERLCCQKSAGEPDGMCRKRFSGEPGKVSAGTKPWLSEAMEDKEIDRKLSLRKSSLTFPTPT